MACFFLDFLDCQLSIYYSSIFCPLNIFSTLNIYVLCLLFNYFRLVSYARCGHFNSLIILLRWWLQNFILRHFYKKFSLFLSHFVRICLQSFEKVLIWSKTLYTFESVEKVAKKLHAKKVINEKVMEKWSLLCAEVFVL